jgi:hypothetical protein
VRRRLVVLALLPISGQKLSCALFKERSGSSLTETLGIVSRPFQRNRNLRVTIQVEDSRIDTEVKSFPHRFIAVKVTRPRTHRQSTTALKRAQSCSFGRDSTITWLIRK